MAIINRDNKGTLYYKFIVGGRTVYRVAKYDGLAILAAAGTKDEARNWKRAEAAEAEARLQAERELAVRVDRERLGLPVEDSNAKSRVMPTLEEFLGEWWIKYGNETYAKREVTRYGYECNFSALLRSYDDLLSKVRGAKFTLNLPVDRITVEAIDTYVSLRRKQGRSERTVSGELKSLMMLLKKAYAWRVINALPSRDILPTFHLKNDSKHKFTLSEEAEDIYLAAAGTASCDLALYATIMMDTSMEPGPVSKMEWPDVIHKSGDFNLGFIQDHCTKNDRRDRPVGMSSRLSAALLLRWEAAGRPPTGYIFPAARRGEHTPRTTFLSAHRRLWGKYYEGHKSSMNRSAPLIDAAGNPKIPYFTLYDFRHACASRMAENGVDLMDIRDALGHASVKMTERYVHTSNKGRSRAFASLNESLEKRKGKD